MTATIHLWICKIQTKRRFNRVAAVISPHFYFIWKEQNLSIILTTMILPKIMA